MITGSIKDDLQVLKQGRPYIRSIVALVVYCTQSTKSVALSYRTADNFLAQLKEDVQNQEDV